MMARVWLKIASLAESRSKAGLGVKPSSISNLRGKLGTQVGMYIYYCGSVLRFFTLVDTSQPSGENRNNKSSRSPCCEGLKVGGGGLDY